MKHIYLDNAATTAVDPLVRDAMLPFLEGQFGNPSSRHPLGVLAREALDQARRQVARATGAAPQHVIFTSGGTEANNLAVLGFARAKARRGKHILIGPTEHPSVTEAGHALSKEGFEVERLRLDASGEIDIPDLQAKLRPETVLVAQMLINNEFGTQYDVARMARIIRAAAPKATLHVDAVQSLGKVQLSIGELGAHSISISAHKVHGPKGCGALILANSERPRPLVFGGGQEGDVRGGTENVAGIAGLGMSAQLADGHVDQGAFKNGLLRETLRQRLEKVPGARLLDPGAKRSPAVCALLLPGAAAEVWMHHLEQRGLYTSVGSACQANKQGIPPALLALGLGEHEAKRVLRVSFCHSSSIAEIDCLVAALQEIELELGQLNQTL
jgi:cysteine desulfurase